ncbi:MAG: leucine-rich repeat domain-containing protein, partial [Oscillospiraceae bacterium]|nr:leucine-rich repeat domain-containing protein [Oscillospiraceae bacterium]
MKVLKKAWIFLLLVCLAALFSTAALANDAASGTFGYNGTWTLEDGVLTISGDGEMNNFSFPSLCPWYSQRESITAVVIEDGVTSIGYYAFSYCSSLTSVTIPDSVTSIVGYAFIGCSSLTSITIPDSVTSIGSYAFYDTAY